MAIILPPYITSKGNFRSITSGNFNVYSTWQIQGVDNNWYSSPYYPKAGNSAVIRNTHNVTLTQNESAASIITEGTGSITYGAFAIAINIDSNVATYQTNIVAQAGTLTGSKLNAVDYFVKQLKAQGLWTSAVDIGLVMGGNKNASFVKVKFPSTFSSGTDTGGTSFVSGDYADATGLTVTTTGKRLSSQVIPTSNGLSNNNIYMCIGMLGIPNANSQLIMTDNNPSSGSMGADLYIGTAAIGMGGGGLQYSCPISVNTSPLLSWSSNGNISYKDFYTNLNPPGVATLSSTFNSAISLFGGRSFSGDTYGTGSLSFWYIGNYLTDAQDVILKKLVRQLWGSLGREAVTKDCVTFGDSLTFGTGSSAYNTRWSYLLANQLGLIERNCGIGGSTFRATVSGILGGYDRRADIYNYNFLTGGYINILYGVNDCRGDSGTGTPAIMADLQSKLTTTINEIIALGQPANKILIGGIPLMTENATPITRQDNYSSYIQAACTATGATYVAHKASMILSGIGTISITSGTAAIVGIGTTFTTSLNVGSSIYLGTTFYTISTITDNTHLTLSSNSSTTFSNSVWSFTNMITNDTVHLNDLGHSTIANNFYALR